MEEKLSFEEALNKLEAAAENLKSSETTLEDAIKNYEEGIFYFNKCSEILEKAEQQIIALDK